MDKIPPQLIGQKLLNRGFKEFTLYLFKAIEGKSFVVEELHNQIFSYFQDIYNGKKLRVNLSLCPRSGKTTLSEYFLIYTITKNPKSNIIYTSYSASLLAEISAKIASVLEHPVYKSLFPQKVTDIEDISLNPINDFWKDYLFKEQGKNTYSARLIRTYAGGVCLFNSIGASITGFGAGVRNPIKFSGFILIDDANKPADIRSQIMREKVLRYYEETLLSRLNSPETPIINVQQRLSLEDLTGMLEAKYNFDTLKVPLLDEKGNCNLPSQYTPERIKELKQNNYMFQAQYMQQPIILGGQVIKRDYFRYYPTAKEYRYKRILIAADTAMKTKEYNDYSVFIAGGITNENKLHILDLVRGKWEAPELEKQAVIFWNKFKRDPKTGVMCNGLYIEDKASGTGLIQSLKAKYGIPVFGVKADTDKLTKVENILPYIEAGNVLLPESETYAFNPELLNECEAFSRDMSHIHDDQVDSLAYLVQEALAKTEVSILDYFM